MRTQCRSALYTVRGVRSVRARIPSTRSRCRGRTKYHFLSLGPGAGGYSQYDREVVSHTSVVAGCCGWGVCARLHKVLGPLPCLRKKKEVNCAALVRIRCLNSVPRSGSGETILARPLPREKPPLSVAGFPLSQKVPRVEVATNDVGLRFGGDVGEQLLPYNVRTRWEVHIEDPVSAGFAPRCRHTAIRRGCHILLCH